MDDSWYSKAAKSGLLGTRAKTSAESEPADWYTGKNKDGALDSARKKVIDTASRFGNMLQPGAHAKDKGE